MRCRSRFATIPFGITIVLSFVAGAHAAIAQTACSPVAVFKYPNKACSITIDRSVPGSPLPVQVPAGTTVSIVVTGQRKTEILKTVITNDAVAKQDVFGNAAKQLVTPLASVVLHLAPPRAPLAPAPAALDLANRQVAMQTAINVVAGMVIEANTRLSCLASYVTFDPKTKVCTQTIIPNESEYENARSQLHDDVVNASQAALPLKSLGSLDTDITAYMPTCPEADQPPESCDQLQTNEKRLDAGATSIMSSQNTLAPFAAVLDSLKNPPVTTIQPITRNSEIKTTVQISAQEQLNKTSVAVANVVITWQQTNWSLSTGVVLSALKNKTFANSPIYENGVPKMDGSGHTYTQVTVAKSYPGVISPIFFVNYRIHNFQVRQGRFAFLFSGGIGANFVTKSADFAVGPTLQYGSVLFSPVLHYGRQTQLINGVHVGDQLGTSPPALPTNNEYRPAIGFGITYRLPIS